MPKKTQPTRSAASPTADAGASPATVGSQEQYEHFQPQAKNNLAAVSEARDRLWTLFERSWENDAWHAGAWIHGRAVDDHVSPLQSRAVRKRAPKVPPTPSAA